MSNFEDRLLSALKDEMRTRMANGTTTVAPAPARRSRRLVGLAAAVAGVAAASTAAVVVLGGAGSEPAYAVSTSADGGVSVRINSFTDPEGLERELAEAGVAAHVDYLPEGQTCKGPRGEHGDRGNGFATAIRRNGVGIAFEIEKGQVPEGFTLVLSVTKSAGGDSAPPSATAMEIVQGPVSECEPVSAPQAPPADGYTHEKTQDDKGEEKPKDGSTVERFKGPEDGPQTSQIQPGDGPTITATTNP